MHAAFTHPALWKLNSIQETYAGTWCYHPGSNPTYFLACTNDTLAASLDNHLRNNFGPGLSIAYYDPKDGTALGGAGWANWAAVPLPIVVCMSGRVEGLENTFSTACRFTVTDNDHELPSSHNEECIVNRSQARVTDGCYTPPSRRPWFRLDDSTSNVLTVIGLIVALPVFGLCRWYLARRARQQAQMAGGQGIPLVSVGRGVGSG